MDNMQTSIIEEIIKLQPKGVLTIPKPIRTRFGLKDNDFIRIKASGGKVYFEPVRTLPYPVRSYTGKDLDEFFTLDKQLSK